MPDKRIAFRGGGGFYIFTRFAIMLYSNYNALAVHLNEAQPISLGPGASLRTSRPRRLG